MFFSLSEVIPDASSFLVIGDWLLHMLHTGLIIFLLVGWKIPAWRKLHLTLALLVWLSWVILGLMVGHIGYCPLTDWHWQLKQSMGIYNLPPSYIEYLYWKLGGGDVSDKRVANLTAAVMVLVTAASLWLRVRGIMKSAGKTDDM